MIQTNIIISTIYLAIKVLMENSSSCVSVGFSSFPPTQISISHYHLISPILCVFVWQHSRNLLPPAQSALAKGRKKMSNQYLACPHNDANKLFIKTFHGLPPLTAHPSFTYPGGFGWWSHFTINGPQKSPGHELYRSTGQIFDTITGIQLYYQKCIIVSI